MDNPIKQYEIKLGKVLEQFLIPEYKIANDTYLEILLSQLSGKYDADLGEKLCHLAIFTEWLDKAVTTWERTKIAPTKSVQTFTLTLCALISNDEIQFIKLDIIDLYTRLCTVLNLSDNNVNPSVKLSYVKMLTSFLQHESGRKWIFKTDRWKSVITYCFDNNTIYVTREGHNFIQKTFETCMDHHEDFCTVVFTEILTPINILNLQQETCIAPEIRDEHLQESLTPMLQLSCQILEACYNNQTARNRVRMLFLNHPTLEQTLWNITNITHDLQFHVPVTRVLVLLYFSGIEVKFDDQMSCEDVRDFGVKLYQLFQLLVTKQSIPAFLSVTHFSHVYWQKFIQLRPRLNPPINTQILFENQMIIFQIMPILVAFNQHRYLDEKSDEYLDMYTTKLFKISCEHTIRLAYATREMLLTQKNLFNIGKQAISSVMKTRQYFHRDRAVIVFQALMYCLKGFAIALRKKEMLMELLTENCGFLASVLEGLAALVKDFKITWRESVETIGLMSFAMELLNCDNISSRLAVLSLELIQLAIENFMPPNLALLVDSMKGSCMPQVAPLLYKRLHDMHWEVRDSSLEILHTITTISEFKYPAFQRLVLDNQLCTLAVSLTTADSESYVRATALKCICSMIKIEAFWSECLINQDIPNKTIEILQTETEGIVRREAAALIRELFDNQKFDKQLLPNVYVTMTTAAVSDLHWEVKVNALSFWDKVINSQLTDQGMIDGLFPSVTFSKENRKIVSLTECEIITRLNKVLVFLSNIGCLAVLITALHDDCDIAVVEAAADILERLVAILEKYNMLDDNVSKFCQQPTKAVWDTMAQSSNNKIPYMQNSNMTNKSDEIIESIVSLDDINLLANVYKNQMMVNPRADIENGEEMCVDKPLKMITPEVFLSYITSKNIKSIVIERSRWLKFCSNDLGSLLDDILKSYDDCDINNLDCY